MEVHHVKALQFGGSDEMTNLVTLCGGPEGCHRKRHASVGRRDTTRSAWAALLYKGFR